MIGFVAKYIPAVALATGAGFTALFGSPQPTPLRRPLASVLSAPFLGVSPTNTPIAADEVEQSGVSDYLSQLYYFSKDAPVGLYVGYHATQQGDKRMHSPTLCLPGSGWTPVGEQMVLIDAGGGKRAMVNRFILQNRGNKILVYYWFQGRGRLTAGQGELKLNAIKDAFLTHRDEEALVRIVVPLDPKNPSVGNTGLAPDTVAARLATAVIPDMDLALPVAP